MNNNDFSSHLPLKLVKSEIVLPSPNRSVPESPIDWLPDFAGYSWIAYGASSLLVIAHFPSPLSKEETTIGPILRQAIELSNCGDSADLNAVAWSPAIPSNGDLAASLENCICLFAHSSRSGSGKLTLAFYPGIMNIKMLCSSHIWKHLSRFRLTKLYLAQPFSSVDICFFIRTLTPNCWIQLKRKLFIFCL